MVKTMPFFLFSESRRLFPKKCHDFFKKRHDFFKTRHFLPATPAPLFRGAAPFIGEAVFRAGLCCFLCRFIELI